ncbi:hypothetical protein PAHAL_7G082000 [Panicum hallii]|jgi:hypothetical protein|uniref:Uncharacterized protein n=1 Tax=Panicum hallii TaxID=206008 RepID=A0A2T8IBE1_9POAL|nr:hypothetical protein PAHAL_7G082000 [Panicum hallii]
MAEFPKIFWDHEGHAHTNALHWEGFPHLLWESLQLFCYTEPPQYDGVEYSEEGVPQCRVKMTIPQHPFCSLWQPIEINMVGFHLVDTIEAAALEAINNFCDQHPEEVAAYPIGLFPTMDSRDPEWVFRVSHCGHLLGDLAEETLGATIRFMNAQHHYQILQHRGMNQLTSIAQSHHRNLDQQVTQIEELQAAIIAKNEFIAQQDETIIHREDQIVESDTLIIQRNTIIEFLQEQVHDLTLELDNAIAHINVLQEQPVPLDVPEEPESEDEEEDPEEIEGVSDLDSEHGDPEPNPEPNHSSSGSQSSVGNLDEF